MSHRCDTYGFTGTTLEPLAVRVQRILDLPLKERDSSYRAGKYYRHDAQGRELVLYNNRAGTSDAWVREEYCEYAVLLEVSGLDDMDAIRDKLTRELGGVLLSSI